MEVNNRLCSMLGYSREELLHQSSRMLYPCDEEYAFVGREKYRQIRDTGTGTVETRFRRKDGSIIEVLLSSSPLDSADLSRGITFTVLDISRRKQVEHDLQYSEERLRMLFGHIRDGVFLLPLPESVRQRRFEMVNEAAGRMTGYQPDEIMKMGPLDLLDPESTAGVTGIVDKLKREGNVLFDVFIVHRDGSRIPVEISAGRVELSGRPFMIATMRDTSLRQRYERDILESRQFLQSIYEGVSHSIFVVDVLPDGVYRYKGMNPYHEELTGVRSDKIAGKTPGELMDPKYAETVVMRYNECLREGRPIRYEALQPFRGRESWWETVLNPVRDETGRICRIIGTSTNITERKEVEERLRKLSVAVEQSPAVVVVTDPSGLIEYVNPKFTQFTGYTFEEVLGKNPKVLKSGLTPQAVYEELWKTILSGRIWHGELYNRKKNGELYWEDAVISAIRNEGGEITNFVAVKEDVTEKKRLWRELIAAKERAEESDRLKTAFLANISHEIRTPMNGILGFSELLKDPDLSGAEREQYIDLIHESGHRLLHLTNELIDISRIEAGETSLHVRETSVNGMLQDLYLFFEPRASKKGLQLVCIPGLSDAESVIRTDSIKMKQILFNLIHNALKFTHEGRVDFGYFRREGLLEFFVIDSGIGIHADLQQKIFERFRQVDNSFTRQYEGAGLGLSISRAYVEMLGGTMRVESATGMGAEFTFTLPYNPPVQNDQTEPAGAELPIAGRMFPALTVLLVDDDEASCLLLKTMLKGAGITLLPAANGLEAMDMVRGHPEINMVLMDIRMPVMNGLEATRQIKQLRPDLPVIAQTSFVSKADRKQIMRSGCDGYIPKPVSRNALLELMQSLLKS